MTTMILMKSSFMAGNTSGLEIRREREREREERGEEREERERENKIQQYNTRNCRKAYELLRRQLLYNTLSPEYQQN